MVANKGQGLQGELQGRCEAVKPENVAACSPEEI